MIDVCTTHILLLLTVIHGVSSVTMLVISYGCTKSQKMRGILGSSSIADYSFKLLGILPWKLHSCKM